MLQLRLARPYDPPFDFRLHEHQMVQRSQLKVEFDDILARMTGSEFREHGEGRSRVSRAQKYNELMSDLVPL